MKRSNTDNYKNLSVRATKQEVEIARALGLRLADGGTISDGVRKALRLVGALPVLKGPRPDQSLSMQMARFFESVVDRIQELELIEHAYRTAAEGDLKKMSDAVDPDPA
jgi:hypothetical protein